MKLEYFGHSFWKVSSAQAAVVIDPYDNIGYPLPKDLRADAVCVSHDHHDHNNVSLIKGNPEVLSKPGVYERQGFSAELISVFHDAELGTKRGRNNLIKLTMDGLQLVHCGDLGHLPGAGVLEKLGKPDLLLVPVGEIYTLALEDIRQLITALQPVLVFPMHYSTPALSFRLGALEAFTRLYDNVIRYKSNRLEITSELLATPHTVILDWAVREME